MRRGENAAACLAAAVGEALPDLLGGHGHDGSGIVHPGLPRSGCLVLAADAATLHALREKTAGVAGPGDCSPDRPAASMGLCLCSRAGYGEAVRSAGR
ncbi:DUF2000 family protein [Streptomyces sp. NBC_01794]|uniref:DUF2000 family protein n=1 Tax=Streptomyces sp. NBC_01794 TaxID=2975942 RepID=UPI003090554D|nr:DUF2000 domain-containing protein [Streptomyces sp. NBC_01794]WSD37607.1 DUF2000 domain-containing protein [Streptomyces sp. NBC_01750]